MGYWLKLENGTAMHINDGRKRQYCECGRVADFACDWRMPAKKSGTCDGSICRRCALQVGPDKHLCRFHQKAYEQWKRRHPEKEVPASEEQLRLGL